MTICTYKLYEESAIIRRVYGTSAVGMAIEKHCVNVWSNNVDLLGFLESIAAVWQGHAMLLRSFQGGDAVIGFRDASILDDVPPKQQADSVVPVG